ncbi:MAG: D-amino acid dehydrogenase, partial [Rhodospirillaceae bacterium]
MSACHVKPWAEPKAPFRAFLWMFQSQAPLLVRPWRWDPPMWSWGMRFLRNCTNSRMRQNTDRALRISLYSRDMLKALRQHTNIQYNQVLKGILHIYRSPEEFAQGRKTADQLSALGLPQDVLSPEECVALEPALAHAASLDLAGGLISHDDESGDAHVFTEELAKLAVNRGAEFRYGVTVERIEASGRRVSRVVTSRDEFEPDAVVLALGSYSPRVAAPIGIDLPIYPAKGYSITVEIENPESAPTVSLMDETRMMVFSRLGRMMRVAGTVELTGWDTSLNPVRLRPLERNARTLFPQASAYENLNPWCGLRPATPDSVPILGATKYENLFLNTGHGTLGWT